MVELSDVHAGMTEFMCVHSSISFHVLAAGSLCRLMQ